MPLRSEGLSPVAGSYQTEELALTLLLREWRCPTPAIEDVHDREVGMRFDHPRPGVPHDIPHPFARLGPIAMNRTIVAGGLFRTVGADAELTVGVIQQLGALNTQAFSIMVVGAIHLHHHANGLAFPLKSSAHRLLEQSCAPIESLWNGASNNLPPPPGAFSFLISRYLGLTPQAHHLSPLPGSDRTSKKSQSKAESVCSGAPDAHPVEAHDVCGGAPEARQIFSPGRKPRG